MIEIKNLRKSFGKKEILRGVNLQIKEAATTVIFGLSGSGKSTIIKHIVGLLQPDSGEITLNGKIITGLEGEELLALRKKIGFLFQSGALFDSMNVYDNVAFPLREHTDLSEDEIKKEVYAALSMVALEPDRVSKLFPDELSGGMRKRAGLARTIILKPQILLYDEPTTGLDPIISDQISQMIIKLQKEFKITSILISHDIKEAFKCADYAAMLYEGEIIESGDAQSFKNSKNEIIRSFLEGREITA
jgi:phospholipid/cholesterol/gamma-HCH transport system ATP-binding protein